MTAVFLDTVGLLALWDESDQWHSAAESSFAALVERRVPLVTTSFVMLECGNASARRSFRLAAADLCVLLESRRELIVPMADDWDKAWALFRRGEGGDAGIVDCISMVVMRRLGLNTVFTNDRHFRNAGFTTLF